MKALNQRLLVSAELLNALPASDRASFTDLGEQALKGKLETVRVYGYRG